MKKILALTLLCAAVLSCSPAFAAQPVLGKPARPEIYATSEHGGRDGSARALPSAAEHKELRRGGWNGDTGAVNPIEMPIAEKKKK